MRFLSSRMKPGVRTKAMGYPQSFRPNVPDKRLIDRVGHRVTIRTKPSLKILAKRI